MVHCLDKLCRWKYKRVCCIVSVLVIMAAVTYLILGLTVARPYAQEQRFISAKCRPTSANYTVNVGLCSCGSGCEGSFPCLQIQVGYRDVMNGYRHATLFDGWSEYHKYKCSYDPYPCEKSEELRTGMVEHYLTKYGNSSTSYPCFYNPDEPWNVVRVKSTGKAELVHIYVWVSLTLMVVSFILVFLWYRFCRDQPIDEGESTDAETALKHQNELQ